MSKPNLKTITAMATVPNVVNTNKEYSIKPSLESNEYAVESIFPVAITTINGITIKHHIIYTNKLNQPPIFFITTISKRT